MVRQRVATPGFVRPFGPGRRAPGRGGWLASRSRCAAARDLGVGSSSIRSHRSATLLAHLAPVEHPPQILRDAGAQSLAASLSSAFAIPGRSRASATFSRLTSRSADEHERRREPARRAVSVAVETRWASADRRVPASRRPVCKCRFGLLKPFVVREPAGAAHRSRAGSSTRMESSRSAKRLALRWPRAASVSIQPRLSIRR